jgi:hypothetical protein
VRQEHFGLQNLLRAGAEQQLGIRLLFEGQNNRLEGAAYRGVDQEQSNRRQWAGISRHEGALMKRRQIYCKPCDVLRDHIAMTDRDELLPLLSRRIAAIVLGPAKPAAAVDIEALRGVVLLQRQWCLKLALSSSSLRAHVAQIAIDGSEMKECFQKFDVDVTAEFKGLWNDPGIGRIAYVLAENVYAQPRRLQHRGRPIDCYTDLRHAIHHRTGCMKALWPMWNRKVTEEVMKMIRTEIKYVEEFVRVLRRQGGGRGGATVICMPSFESMKP